jgi:hypothetical protein
MSIIKGVLTWPKEAQDEPLRALTAIEEKHVRVQLTVNDKHERKLASLRETINRSIERGGSLRMRTWKRVFRPGSTAGNGHEASIVPRLWFGSNKDDV